jgi:hypothetical protein
MKNFKCFVFLMTVFFVFNLAAACGGGPPPIIEEKDHAEFQLKKTAVSVLLFPEQTSGSPRMNFNLNLLDISGPGDLETFFEALLYDGEKADEYKKTLIEGYRAAYRDIRETMEKNPGMNPAVMDWDYKEYMDIRTFSDRGMVIGRKKEYYTGGAHGMLQKTYYVIDLTEQKVLAWEDLFTDPKSPELRRMVLDALREYAGLEKNAPLSSGIYFEDEPGISGNFFLTPDGLGFRWDPYEISPYSAGAIEIVISWKNIKNLLNKEGQAILNGWLQVSL